MALVKEVEPGVFLTWFGTNELPPSIEFTMSADELAAHGLYVPLPEDTMPPTHLHEMGPVHTVRDADGLVRRVVEWQVSCSLEDARAAIAAEIEAEILDRADEREIIEGADAMRAAVEAATSFDELFACAFPPRAIDVRALGNPTKIESL